MMQGGSQLQGSPHCSHTSWASHGGAQWGSQRLLAPPTPASTSGLRAVEQREEGMGFPTQEEQQKQRTAVEFHGVQLIVPDSTRISLQITVQWVRWGSLPLQHCC